MDCKHKSHARYRDAEEGLYIQVHMAERDLADLLRDARASGRTPGGYITLNDHKVVVAGERLAFGRSELAEATTLINRHFDSGRCANLRALEGVK